MGIALEALSDAEDVDTLGGLVTTLAGRVPIRGEIISSDSGVEFEILEADPRRLKRIKIHPVASRKAMAEVQTAKNEPANSPVPVAAQRK